MGFHFIEKIIHHLQLGFAIIGSIHSLAEGMGVTQAFAVPANMLTRCTQANVFTIEFIMINEIRIHDFLNLINLRCG